MKPHSARARDDYYEPEKVTASPTQQSLLEEFDQNVNELRNEETEKIHYFGCKELCEEDGIKTIYTATDWGHVRDFLLTAMQKAALEERTRLITEVREEVQEYIANGDRSWSHDVRNDNLKRVLTLPILTLPKE
jgi:hypothetical protein